MPVRTGLANVIAGQNIFPLINTHEMPGQVGENEVVDAPPTGTTSVDQFPFMWEAIMARLRAIPEYFPMFRDAFPEVTSADKMKISHLVNALAAFQAVAFRSDQSPFDRFLRGESTALTAVQAMDDPIRAQEIVDANELAPSTLSSAQLSDLMAFLDALTDPNVLDMSDLIPASVPSGLPVAD